MFPKLPQSTLLAVLLFSFSSLASAEDWKNVCGFVRRETQERQLEAAPVPNWSTFQSKGAAEIIAEMEAMLGISKEQNTLFQRTGLQDGKDRNLRVNGHTITYEFAMLHAAAIYHAFPSFKKSPKGLLFHGSTSGSLLGFSQMRKAKRTPGLYALTDLNELGMPPFGGEIVVNFRWKTNIGENVSTVFISNFVSALRDYAFVDLNRSSVSMKWKPGWSPERSIDIEKIIESRRENATENARKFDEKCLKLEKLRQSYWEELSTEEKGLVFQNFPIVYRIYPMKSVKISPANSDVAEEILVDRRVRADTEIAEMLVPSEVLPKVKAFLEENGGGHILVTPLEALAVPNFQDLVRGARQNSRMKYDEIDPVKDYR